MMPDFVAGYWLIVREADMMINVVYVGLLQTWKNAALVSSCWTPITLILSFRYDHCRFTSMRYSHV